LARARRRFAGIVSAARRAGIKQAPSLTLRLAGQQRARQYVGNNCKIGISRVTDHHGSASFALARVVLDHLRWGIRADDLNYEARRVRCASAKTALQFVLAL
jgi:hypothetical protein